MFSSILGNESCKHFLTLSLEKNQLHHALLFTGPTGVGKTLFAKALANILLGSTRDRIDKETHPDLHTFYPEGKMGLHSMDRIQALIEETHKPPFESSKKVFILYRIDRMLPTSANALLKTFEEPHPDITFILLSSEPRQLLSTIRSRCLHLSFSALSDDQVSDYLQEHHYLEPLQAQREARLAQGSLGKAIQRVKNPRFSVLQNLLFQGLTSQLSPTEVAEEIESSLTSMSGEEASDSMNTLLSFYLMWVRDQELQKAGGKKRFLYLPEQSFPVGISLFLAEKLVLEVKQALERNVKISVCFDRLLRSSFVTS